MKILGQSIIKKLIKYEKMLIFYHIEARFLSLMSSLESTSVKPKRTLNPIIKEMNSFRNNVIGEHIGSKAPIKTAPIFKLAIAAARSDLGIGEKDKNTIEIVNKASSLFQADPEKYVSLAASQPIESKPKKEKKTKSSKGKNKELSVESTDDTKTKVNKQASKPKSKAKVADKPTKKEKKPASKKKSVKDVVQVLEDDESDSDSDKKSEEDSDIEKLEILSKAKKGGKKKQDTDSESDSESDSDSDSD